MAHKIIIHNYTEFDDLSALQHIATVVNEGEVSKTSKGNQYCFLTTFKDGSAVECTKNDNTYTFKLYPNNELLD